MKNWVKILLLLAALQYTYSHTNLLDPVGNTVKRFASKIQDKLKNSLYSEPSVSKLALQESQIFDDVKTRLTNREQQELRLLLASEPEINNFILDYCLRDFAYHSVFGQDNLRNICTRLSRRY